MGQFKPKQPLSALVLFLEITNLHQNDLIIWSTKIPGWFLSAVHSIPMIWQLYLIYLYCVQFDYKLGSVSGALCTSCGIVQILAIYACLMLKKDLIMETIDLLQGMVTDRKFTFLLKKAQDFSIEAIFFANRSYLPAYLITFLFISQ